MKPFRLCKPIFSAFSLLSSTLTLFRYVYCLQQLELDVTNVNVNGGAIALGHPLGATGVRQVVTGLAELGRRGERVLVSSMCIGSG
jgi:acetyl-CoA acyltransferase 1